MVKIEKMKASTLVETIVAMLIVTIAFSLALILMVNLSKNSNNSIKTKAYLLANDIYIKTKSEKAYIDQEFNYGDVIIKKTVTEYKNNEDLFLLNISAFDKQNRRLLDQNELVIIENSEKN